MCSPSLSFNLPFLLHTGYAVLVNNPAFLISAPVFLPSYAATAFCFRTGILSLLRYIGNMSIGNQYEQHDNLSSREVPAQQAMITCEIHRHCSYDASQLYVLKNKIIGVALAHSWPLPIGRYKKSMTSGKASAGNHEVVSLYPY